jgi:hypothetical protein
VAKRLVGVLGVAIALIAATAALGRSSPNRAYPDTADRNTLITLRDGVRRDAVQMLARIVSCERRVHDPYGAGRNGLNHCLTTLLNVNLLKSRYEQVMLIGVLHDLSAGPCLGLASGLMDAISELGNESETWFGDAENPDPSAASLERADAHDMRSIAGGILALTAARSWRTACRPRPYDPNEQHPTRRVRPRTLGFLWPTVESLQIVA